MHGQRDEAQHVVAQVDNALVMEHSQKLLQEVVSIKQELEVAKLELQVYKVWMRAGYSGFQVYHPVNILLQTV